MSKFCELCGKSTVAGRSIQHKHSVGWRYKAPRTTRQFKPNLRKLELIVDDKAVKAVVCMKCYKRLRKEEAEVMAPLNLAVAAK